MAGVEAGDIGAEQQLQRQHEIDALREEAVKLHADDWRLLARAAETLLNGEHYGFVVAGSDGAEVQRLTVSRGALFKVWRRRRPLAAYA